MPDRTRNSEFAGWLADYGATHQLPPGFAELAECLHKPLATAIASAAAAAGHLFVVGLCGPQGSGKSTMVQVLARLLVDHGLRGAVLSLDDLYHTRAARQRLAAAVHPLFATRGPPGTHDVALGLEVIAALAAGRQAALPRFDKARDDRCPRDAWPLAGPGIDVLLLEGWCVGARAQSRAELAEPVNALERDEDRDGRWRAAVNAALDGAYARLFAQLDLLVQLRAPSFATVTSWRLEQEDKLRTTTTADPASRVMGEAEVRRFVQFFERITRQIDREMPTRADILIDLDEQRQVRNLTGRLPFAAEPFRRLRPGIA